MCRLSKWQLLGFSTDPARTRDYSGSDWIQYMQAPKPKAHSVHFEDWNGWRDPNCACHTIPSSFGSRCGGERQALMGDLNWPALSRLHVVRLANTYKHIHLCIIYIYEYIYLERYIIWRLPPLPPTSRIQLFSSILSISLILMFFIFCLSIPMTSRFSYGSNSSADILARQDAEIPCPVHFLNLPVHVSAWKIENQHFC